jgi:FkbM family methyltransferase
VGNWISARLKGLISRAYAAMSPELKRHTADLVSRNFEELVYRRLAELGFRPGAIIDVGAYQGNWTRLARNVFGPVPILMVEAQPALREGLEKVAAELPGSKLDIAALGATSGELVTFYDMGTGSSYLPEQSDAVRTERIVTTRTLDEVVLEKLSELSSIFLKIDVQGAELHVLSGGARTLERCELVQLECAMLQYNKGAPLLPEVVAFMADRGFLPIEISGFSRPERHLVQIDLIFARKGSRLRPEFFEFGS